ncbi:hypothetical protein KGA66_06150 [Actinocrinis puniceicyclus]|uniref:Uncharacterized protein n=1 Tax=Actinocrinis puniceicyclus TaxID=977794 RepID=A0A8J7WI60_9ACTN|nr:hypothetical protein [Actinocrinis puniceicyclus]MBS2962621.1 hypothetical protein [Actinocrinis puniceicyclus]
MKFVIVGLVLLLMYVACCWVAAFVRNMARDLAARAARRVRARAARSLAWRRFRRGHAEEFADPQFQWPAQGWTQEVPW